MVPLNRINIGLSMLMLIQEGRISPPGRGDHTFEIVIIMSQYYLKLGIKHKSVRWIHMYCSSSDP
jgi:hypothetical protein